ncbi:MAG: hypothetical protein IKY83_04975 [Proteobacteria bacterium]|nr:hypothetical protein [Pseudomonadota bacterium]
MIHNTTEARGQVPEGGAYGGSHSGASELYLPQADKRAKKKQARGQTCRDSQSGCKRAFEK